MRVVSWLAGVSCSRRNLLHAVSQSVKEHDTYFKRFTFLLNLLQIVFDTLKNAFRSSSVDLRYTCSVFANKWVEQRTEPSRKQKLQKSFISLAKRAQRKIWAVLNCYKKNEKCKHNDGIQCQLKAAFNVPVDPEWKKLYHRPPWAHLPSLRKSIRRWVSISNLSWR